MSDVSLDKAVNVSPGVSSLAFRVITYDARVGIFTIVLDDGNGNTKIVSTPPLSATNILAIKSKIEQAVGSALGAIAIINP